MALAVGPSIEFYHSDNLLSWEKTGIFLLSSVNMTGICECPDCFSIACDQSTKWILSFSLCGNEGPNIMPYFVGEFDGNTFIPDRTDGEVNLLDYALDNYAAVTFSNADRCLMIGWGENWTYTQDTPATDYRGKMTCIKEVNVINTNNSYKLIFSPIEGYEEENFLISPGNHISLDTINGGKLIITVLDDCISVDRSKAITTKFHDCFDEKRYNVFFAKRTYENDCTISVIRDNNFYEIFADMNTIVFSINTY